jgi:hypothetical protein
VIARPRADLATCPTCEGTGSRTVTCGDLGKHGLPEWSDKSQPCLACRATGQVEAWRVCSGCGAWRDSCTCPARGTRVIASFPEGTASPELPVGDQGDEFERPEAALPPPQKFTPSCIFGLVGCELAEWDDGFWFCPRCSWATKDG